MVHVPGFIDQNREKEKSWKMVVKETFPRGH